MHWPLNSSLVCHNVADDASFVFLDYFSAQDLDVEFAGVEVLAYLKFRVNYGSVLFRVQHGLLFYKDLVFLPV